LRYQTPVRAVSAAGTASPVARQLRQLGDIYRGQFCDDLRVISGGFDFRFLTAAVSSP